MATAQRDPGESSPARGEDARDTEWFRLTEGMDPYERFRFIARHVLGAAIQDAQAYATDERIFEGTGRDRREHLRAIEQALREDDGLSPLERDFLCAAVTRAMSNQDLEASCPWDLFGRVGAKARLQGPPGDPS